MTLFEFTFGLMAVILGLALSQLALNFTRLATAGRSVRWAPEPVMLTIIVFLLIVVLWFVQWQTRDQQEASLGGMVLRLAQVMLPAMAAAAVLPESLAPEGKTDLLAHYDRTRRFTFAVLALGVVFGPLSGTARTLLVEGVAQAPWLRTAPFVGYFAIYVTLAFVRVRWINIVGLLLLVLTGLPMMLSVRAAG